MYCGLLGLRYAAAPGALVGVGAAVTTRCAARALAPEDCVWEDLKDTVEAARGCILLRRRPFHNQGGLLHQLLPEHRHVPSPIWAAAQSRRKTKDKVKAQPEAIGLLPTAVSHRLERPGPRVPWSVAAVQEELGLGYAHRYTDSRSHIKPEAKAAVEEAKLRYAALPPAGLVHEVAEIVEEESAAAGRPGRPAPAPAPRRHRAGTATRGCCLLCRACALPPPRASRSTAPKTVPTSDAPLRTAAAAVLQKFVGEGHGRRIFDDNDRDVKPADVQALRRALGLWHLDDKGRVGDER
ncbi:hypothetical protein BM221_002224 [Beauveria bassiana]|uniref:Uncharacterized protein n=1 Tax=Beauveria bassiana TaxID=176275 RepID=A0A2N6NXX1_BEABA|nr:hypothetical protein BM221_002224 [Beauveria bassiana]